MKNPEKIFEFIKSSKSVYHTVDTVKKALLENGYTEISERDIASFKDGKMHFVIRDSSLIAFCTGESADSFMIAASHADTPTFKVKGTVPCAQGGRLAVEAYGGAIYYSWLDRPLSIAGRAAVKSERGVQMRLVDFDLDLAVIPSVPIHFNRTVNDGVKLNVAVDMLPLISSGECPSLGSMIAENLSVPDSDVIAHDLYLYLREEPRRLGVGGELILSPRIDDLSCAYASLEAFISAKPSCVNVLCVFNNEEVGSHTKQGAGSAFLRDTLVKIAGSEEKYMQMIGDSFLASADNAHAIHPAHPELSDKENAPRLGGGVVVKYNANQKYTTDACSDAVFRTLCERADVPVQSYTNRADIIGGSTLGNILISSVSVSAVDIGLPQLAMHSSCECVSAADVEYMTRVLTELYSSRLECNGGDIDVI